MLYKIEVVDDISKVVENTYTFECNVNKHHVKGLAAVIESQLQDGLKEIVIFIGGAESFEPSAMVYMTRAQALNLFKILLKNTDDWQRIKIEGIEKKEKDEH